MDVSWIITKAEHRRINAFELWCWRRLLRASGTARLSNRSILKEINSEYSLEGLMLNLIWLQYFGHLMRKADSLEKTLMLRQKEKGVAEDEMFKQHHRLNGHEFEQTAGDSGRGSLVGCLA